ncbi:hypothetical protein [Actinocorallia longicatena]|uniref:Uncharacterized protein n=1 Tax=Actinocorallia longicatena TaxID=111803 RepID=A0ABP6PXD2_9ACTN
MTIGWGVLVASACVIGMFLPPEEWNFEPRLVPHSSATGYLVFSLVVIGRAAAALALVWIGLRARAVANGPRLWAARQRLAAWACGAAVILCLITLYTATTSWVSLTAVAHEVALIAIVIHSSLALVTLTATRRAPTRPTFR